MLRTWLRRQPAPARAPARPRLEELEPRVVLDAANERFVGGLWLDLFGRSVGNDSLGHIAIAHLDQGAPQAQVVGEVLASTDFLAKLVTDVHRQVLRRGPTRKNLNAGVAFLRRGGKLHQLQARLLGSKDYFLRNGGSNESFLRAVYRDVAAPLTGAVRQARLNQLRGGLSRERLAARVLTSPTALLHQVDQTYQRFLGRDPDGDGLETQAQALRDGGFSAVLFNLLTSPEYFHRHAPATSALATVTLRTVPPPPVGPVVGIRELSPTRGNDLVSLTQQTVIRFDGAVDPATVTADTFVLTAQGRRVPGRVEVSSTGLFATFFPDMPLPASTAVRVEIDGDRIRGRDGQLLDADGDGLPGGLQVAEFRTVPVTRLTGTNVFGFVRDASTGQPVVGATVRIEGLADASVTTDANGRFELLSTPAPQFFVRIDGSTATTPPTGRRYSSVTRSFHSVAGQTVSVGTDVFLPAVSLTDVQPLDPAVTTSVVLGAGGLAELAGMFPTIDPAVWQQTAVVVTPGSARDDDGTTAHEASLTPVSVDTLPVPLPPLLDPAVVFSMQAGPATYFDVPAALTLPNVDELPAGGEGVLWWYDQAGGHWSPAGAVTVATDGLTVATDPGVGLFGPGWYFVAPPLATLAGGQPIGNRPVDEEKPPAVEVRMLTSGQADTLSLTFAPPNGSTEQTRVVEVAVAGRFFDQFYDASGSQGLKNETLTLRPGDAAAVRQASLRSLQDLLARGNGGRPFDQDVLYGAKITVTETVTLIDGSRSRSSRTLLPYLYVDQGDDNAADGVLAFRDAVADGAFSSSRPYELRLDGAPAPTFVFPGSSSNDWSDQRSAGGAALRFDPAAVGERVSQARAVVTVGTDSFVSTTGLTLRGEGTTGTTIYLNRAAALAVAQAQGLTEAEAAQLYASIRTQLESIIRDLGSSAETQLRVNDAAGGQGVGRAIAVVWNFAENEFLDKNGDGRPQANEAADIDGDGVYFETPGEFIDLNRNGVPDQGEYDPARLLDLNDNGVRDIPGDYLDYNRNGRFDVANLLGRAFTGVDFATAEFGDRLVAHFNDWGELQRSYIFDNLFDRNPQGSFELMLNTIVGNGGATAAEQGVYGGTVVAHEAFHTLGGVHSDNMGIGAFDILNHLVPPGNRLTPVSRAAMLAALDLNVEVDDLEMARRAYRRGYNFRAAEPAAFPDALFAAPMAPEGPQLTLLTDAGDPTFDALTVGAVAADGTGGQLVSIPVRVRNSGDEPLILHGVSFADGGRGFAVAGFVAGTAIAPGDEIVLTLVFDPTAIGAASDTLTFDTNATGPADDGDLLRVDDGEGDVHEGPTPDGKFPIALSGRGLDPDPVFRLEINSNNNLGGGGVGTRTTRDAFLTVTNDGAAVLRFTPSVAAGGADFGLGALAGVEQVLAPGASLAIPLAFNPSTIGLLPGTLRFVTNDPDRATVSQGVVGTGVPVGGVGEGDLHWGNDFAVLQTGDVVDRTVTNRAGAFTFRAPIGGAYFFGLFDPVSGLVLGSSGTAGITATDVTTALAFRASTAPDTDADGLPDDIEFIAGTRTDAVDSDGDGVSDFAEIVQGLNPLDGIAYPTGVIASLALPGAANDVAVAGDLAYVATGTHGLAIVDAAEFQNPILLGQLDLPGDAQSVSVDAVRQLAAVGGSSLLIVDVSDPMTPTLLREVPGAVDRVEVVDGVAYVTSGTTLRAVDLLTGTVLQTLTLPGSGTVTDLAREGTTLYAYVSGADRLVILDVARQGQAAVLGSVPVDMAAADVGLAAGNGVAWLAGSGLQTVDVSNPSAPVLIREADASFPARRVALNGSGLGLVAVPGSPRMEVYDVRNPSDTDARLDAFTLGAAPLTVAVSRGVAFVGAGSRLELVNYLPFDTKGQQPAATLTATPPDADASLPGVQVREGTTIPVRVAADDDVQVSRVELLVNGAVVQEDVSFPFDFFAEAPLRTPAQTSVALQVRVTDTGGNSTLSNVLTFPLTADTTPPALVSVEPTNASVRDEGLQIVRVRFSEALAPATVEADNFQLRDGAGNLLDPLGVELRDDDHLVQLTFAPLPAGSYWFFLNGRAMTDRAGNALPADAVSRFTLGPRATLATTAVDAAPGTPGLQVVEGTPLPINVTVPADVIVTRIELLLDDRVIGVDTAAPFAFAAEAPFTSSGPTARTFRARVRDASGFETLTPPLVIGVVEDVTPPAVVLVTPAAGARVAPGLTSVRLDFSEPIVLDPATAPTIFQLFEAGPNGTLGDADDVPVAITSGLLQDGNRQAVLTATPLLAGSYQVRVRRDSVSDRAGNGMGAGTFTSDFSVRESTTLVDELFARPGTALGGPTVLDGGTLRLGVGVNGSLISAVPGTGLVFDGVEFLAAGDPFAGFSIAANGLVAQNATPGGSGIVVQREDISSGTQHAIRITGLFGGLRVQRVVLVADGQPYALIATRVTNLTGKAVDRVAWMENLNPEQGVTLEQGPTSFNDVTAGGRLVVGGAVDPDRYPDAITVGLGSLDGRATVSADGGHLSDPFAVLSTPSDPQGAPGDLDLHAAFNFGTLQPGQSATGALLLVVGRSTAEAVSTFNQAAAQTRP